MRLLARWHARIAISCGSQANRRYDPGPTSDRFWLAADRAARAALTGDSTRSRGEQVRSVRVGPCKVRSGQCEAETDGLPRGTILRPPGVRK